LRLARRAYQPFAAALSGSIIDPAKDDRILWSMLVKASFTLFNKILSESRLVLINEFAVGSSVVPLKP